MLTRIPPQVPPETARLARSIFSDRNLYLLVGDSLCYLTAEFGAQACSDASLPDAQLAHLLALVTIFQFIEQLTDRQADEALRHRMDWKYALHLPPAFPASVIHLQTCEFRRRLNLKPVDMEALQSVVERMHLCGILDERLERAREDTSAADAGSAPTARRIVGTVCCLNRLDRLTAALMGVIEHLAVYHTAWLRSHTQAYWYQRYHPSARIRALPESPDEWSNRFEMIGRDGYKLLESIQAAPELNTGPAGFSGAAALLTLQHELANQFEVGDPRITFRRQSCLHCGANPPTPLI